MDFKRQFDEWIKTVNAALNDCVDICDGAGSKIYSAMKYSLMAGGKRLRAVLALAVCEMLQGCKNDVLPFACAIEMIHTYSLIHDDLPDMDNDDYRRGIPANHKVFGNAMAILAGDALLNKAYEIMTSSALKSGDAGKEKLTAMHIIAGNAGADGMIRGQAVDLESQGASITKETLEYMHKCKTGALIIAPVLASAVICGASDDERMRLRQYAENLGLAFQIKDDIMDVKGSLDKMGKTAGKDAVSGKTTYVSVYGVKGAEELLEKAVNAAVDSLECFGAKASFLKELAFFIRDRDY